MSRKQATFGQLIDYMEDGRQDKKFTLKHNLYANKAEKIKEEFQENAAFIAKRKNGVYMYHEVLSITKSKTLSDNEQKERLRDIALQYIEKRANNNLAYAVLHDDKKDNFHYHILISSNEVQETKKHRLTKEQFDTIKKDIEKRVLQKYPELEQKELINKQAKEKLSNKGAELKRRTGETNQRDSVKNRLHTVFSSTKDKQSFFEGLSDQKLEVYVRGNNIGVIDLQTGRKHRLKSLDMLDDFNKISAIVEESQKQQEKEKIKEEPKQEEYESNNKQEEPVKEEVKEPEIEPDYDLDYTIDDFEDFEDFEGFDNSESESDHQTFDVENEKEHQDQYTKEDEAKERTKEDIINSRREEMRQERANSENSKNTDTKSSSNKR